MFVPARNYNTPHRRTWCRTCLCCVPSSRRRWWTRYRKFAPCRHAPLAPCCRWAVTLSVWRSRRCMLHIAICCTHVVAMRRQVCQQCGSPFARLLIGFVNQQLVCHDIILFCQSAALFPDCLLSIVLSIRSPLCSKNPSIHPSIHPIATRRNNRRVWAPSSSAT
jgi:hypothetical protein